MLTSSRAVLHAFVAAVVLWCCAGQPGAQAPTPPAFPAPAALAIDVTVVNRAGAVPDRLMAEDLAVTVGGRVRPALWIRRVSRGPGAVADAAALRAKGVPGTTYVAEPSRTVFIIVDEASLPVGGQRQAIEAASALLDRLGMSDHVAVIRLPLPSNDVPLPTLDRPVIRDAITRIVGRVPPEGVRTDSVTPDSRHVGGNPMGARINREDQPERPESSARPMPDEGLAGARDGLDGLVRTLKAASALPGRKVVAFYSGGLDDESSGRLAAAGRAAAEARAILYVFQLRATSDGRYARLDARLLDRLAVSTGGLFVAPGRTPVKDLESVTPELAACYQIGVERTDDDARRGVVDLRVEARRSDLVVRASTVVAVRAPATDDIEPPDPVTRAPAASPESEACRGAGRRAPSGAPPAATVAGGPEVNLVLGRLSDYALAYIGQYSAVVAEEDYRQDQRVGGRDRRLRADLLFVRAEPSREWVSFRDVFEVDGRPVRDRDTRLQDLFLKPKPNAQAQLQSIKDESARYNIGPFERNINVPLYPLKILLPANRQRFVFSVGRITESGGVKAWQLDFTERARPTLVLDREGLDIPLEGHFLVEQATGAIVESTVRVERQDYTVSIVVRYVRDPKLGLWVPSEMKETYGIPKRVGSPGVHDGTVLTCTARYKNFRRFQVSTDIQIVAK
jgi:hypothetical protein